MKIENPVWFAYFILIICIWIYDIGACGFSADKTMVISLAFCLAIKQIKFINK